MVALQVDSTAKVDALHRKALQLGAKDEGAAGPRVPSAFRSAACLAAQTRAAIGTSVRP